MNRSVFLSMRQARRLALRGAAVIDWPANRLNRRTPYPPVYLRREVGPLRVFETTAASMIRSLELRAGLQPDGRLLDMGCGCGAIPLVMLAHGTSTGGYIGLDVDRRMIDWCNAHLADDKFRFDHHDYWSATYNTGGQRFLPFAVDDGWATVIVMKSVFTHMLPDDTDWYLRETARVLAPNGKAILTAALYDETDRDMLQRFQHDGGGYRFERAESPESSIAVSRAWMDEHMGAAGLKYGYTAGARQGAMLVEHVSHRL
jgi:cyclopropane fatty-acyl-phospholipid synthase-like methyltransferase